MSEAAESNRNSSSSVASSGDTKPPPFNNRRHRRRPPRNKAPPTDISAAELNSNSISLQHTEPTVTSIEPPQNTTTTRRVSHNRSNQSPPSHKSKNAWKQHVPAGTVDPISLESIRSLRYPPFVLKALPPFDPVTVWPPPSVAVDQKKTSTEEIHRQNQLLPVIDTNLCIDEDDDESNNINNNTANVLYHFFDGKVLAYYLVSQLQFMDPLNRRELSRDEVVSLDVYMKKHTLYTASFASVLEAFDAKNKDLLRAASAADSATSSENPSSNANTAGRAFLLQQEARDLLQALFASSSRPTMNTTNTTRSVDAAHPSTTRRNGAGTRNRNLTTPSFSTMENTTQDLYTHSSSSHHPYRNMDEHGIYGDSGGGLLIIDDDLNPGLRGGPVSTMSSSISNSRNTPRQQQGQVPAIISNTSSYSNILGHVQRVQAFHFPQLPPVSDSNVLHRTASSIQDSHQESSLSSTRIHPKRAESSPNLGGKSKTLKKIANLVTKSNPQEMEKQRKAREEWLRKTAMIQNAVFDPTVDLSTSVQPSLNVMNISTPSRTSGYARLTTPAAPTLNIDSMIERNKLLAEALGVTPSTVRDLNVNSGWTRPTSFLIERDEFGHELNTFQYPDSLIIQARERMDELIKLERKWMVFLKDDTAASISLKPMDKPTRAFVHEYSDYWKLQTQSYDPPPNRYVHCVKMFDTAAPYPQLSTSARHWRGPSNDTSCSTSMSSQQQSTGQLTRSESYLEVLHLDERPPLKLSKPGEIRNVQESMYAVGQDPTSISNRSGSIPSSVEPAPRFAPLISERERPKLVLQRRSVPMEESTTMDEKKLSSDMRIKAKLNKEEKRMRAKAKRESILAKAFASDESSDWDVGDALYSGEDDE